jgi:hypothetical protein
MLSVSLPMARSFGDISSVLRRSSGQPDRAKRTRAAAIFLGSLLLAGCQQTTGIIEPPQQSAGGLTIVAAIAALCIASSVIAWCLTPWAGRRIVKQIGVEGLTTIAVLSGVHFIVAYASRLVGYVLAGVSGPFAVFLAGIGNEGLASLVVAALVVLVPHVGVIALSSLTVFSMQAMFSGQLGFVDLLMVSVSIIVQESFAWLLGVTRGSAISDWRRDRASLGIVARVGLAIGLGNAMALYAQFCLVQTLYRLYFAAWYIAAVVVVTGLVYGGIGALGGASLGLQLRRTAR